MSTPRTSDEKPANAAAATAAVPVEVAVDVDACLRACAAEHGRAPAQTDLLPLLLALQARVGTLRDAHLRALAEALNISRAEVHGVASFYPDLRHAPDAQPSPGDAPQVELCAAEACQARGANELLRHAAGDARVRSVFCLGNCACGPSARMGDQVFANVTPSLLDTLLGGAGSTGHAQ